MLALRRQLGDRRGEAATLVNLGKSRAALGDWDRAASDLKAALDLSVAAKDKLAEMRACLQLGTVESKREQFEAAAASLRRGLELSQSIENPAAEATARYGLARLQRACGDMKAARREIEGAIDIVESIRTKILSRDLRASFLGSMRENYEFYVGLLMELDAREPGNGYVEQAFEASERGRARSLIDLLGEGGSGEETGATAESLEARTELQVRIDRKVEERLRLLAGEHTEAQAEQGRREIEMLLAEYERLEARIRSASARQDERTRPEPLSLAAIRKQVLDADTVLLEYSLGEERSYLWIVSIDSLKSVQLPGRSEITSVARRAYEAVSVRGVLGAKDKLAEVARVVLDPAGDLSGKRLVVAGDGVLHYVPFAALPETGASGTPLVARHEIVHVPSASTLALQRRELAGRERPPKTLALFADPVFGADDERVTGSGAHPAGISGPVVRSAADAGFGKAGIPRLPFTRREADAILRLVPRDQSRAALDFDATRLSATDRDLEQYRFLHFATHCFLDSARPQLTGIVLSLVDRAGHPLKGFLTPHDAAELKLSADLVVLSGCRTALGKEVWGEGLVGLTRAFFSAGAARVAASLWRVDDSATADLMARFYRAMLGAPGKPPAAALREAQLALLKERRWQDPYFWAAFQLHGDWR